MQGQDNIKEYFRHVCDSKGLDNFYLVVGPKGHGKTTLIEEVAEMAHCTVVEIEDGSVDSIRELVENVQSLTIETAFILDGRGLNIHSQNALLKTLEDTPDKAHIFIELEDRGQILNTIRSRATIIEMEPYTRDDLIKFTKDDELLSICENVGQVIVFDTDQGREIREFVKTIANSIGRISLMNVFNISNYIDFKDRGDKFPLGMVMHALKYEMAEDFSKTIIVTKYYRQMKHKSINKRNSFDMMVVELWEHERR